MVKFNKFFCIFFEPLLISQTEEAQEQLEIQGNGQRESHQRILQDLSIIQENAHRVWEQMGKFF